MPPAECRGLREPNGSWKIAPILRRCSLSLRSDKVEMSFPLKIISPDVGLYTRRIQRPVVVLPHPLSPTSPRVSCFFISKLMSSTALTSPTFFRKSPQVIGKYILRFLTSSKTLFCGASIISPLYQHNMIYNAGHPQRGVPAMVPYCIFRLFRYTLPEKRRSEAYLSD